MKLHEIAAGSMDLADYQTNYLAQAHWHSFRYRVGEINRVGHDPAIAKGDRSAGIPSHVSADLTFPPELTNMEMRERMSGNICRCGAYSNIAEAIAEVAGSKT